jgi:hypothetical protein
LSIRNLLVICMLSGVAGAIQVCPNGDCQPGSIAGPFSAPQTAEYTHSNFQRCSGSACGTGFNGTNQIEGIDAMQDIGGSYQFFDQTLNIDENIAVGPNITGQHAQVLEWANTHSIQAFDKVTGEPLYSVSGGTMGEPRSVINLFSTSTQADCNESSGNVQVIYDRLDDVFVISRRVTYTVGSVSHYALCLSISSASDLSNSKTNWYSYEFVLDSVIPCLPSSNGCTSGSNYYYYPDWPRTGTWSNGFYITFDLTDPTNYYLQAGFEACQLDRADMVKGLTANPITCYTYMVPSEPSLIHSVDVGDIDSPTGPESGEPEYFLSIVNPSNAQQGKNGESVCTSQSQSSPCTSNQLALFTWGTSGLSMPTFLAVDSYTPSCYDTSSNGSETNTECVPVPSTNIAHMGEYGQKSCGDYGPPCVDSLGDRMANRLTYNNLSSTTGGPNGEFLTASHVVMESLSNQRSGIRYYILQVSNGSASVLVNSGSASGPPDLQDPNDTLFYFMPSAALDMNGNLGIAYTTSGAYCSSCQTQPDPAINFVVLPWESSTTDTPTLIIQGTGDEENTLHWGEYAATQIDPGDNLTFYGVGEYFDTSQTGKAGCSTPANDCYTWQTRIFRGQYGDGFTTEVAKEVIKK